MAWFRRGKTRQTATAERAAGGPTKTFDKAELKERLTRQQYRVTQQAGTEQAFSGEYCNTKTPGIYLCVVCDEALFASDTKFDSGTGWPSFWQAISTDAVATETDRAFGMRRTEALCATCGAHLGHIFRDGPAPTGDRFCMNSASLRLNPTSS